MSNPDTTFKCLRFYYLPRDYFEQLLVTSISWGIRFRIGVIPAENLLVFTRVLWRVCRGNVFVKHAQIDEPLEDPATVSV